MIHGRGWGRVLPKLVTKFSNIVHLVLALESPRIQEWRGCGIFTHVKENCYGQACGRGVHAWSPWEAIEWICESEVPIVLEMLRCGYLPRSAVQERHKVQPFQERVVCWGQYLEGHLSPLTSDTELQDLEFALLSFRVAFFPVFLYYAPILPFRDGNVCLGHCMLEMYNWLFDFRGYS